MDVVINARDRDVMTYIETIRGEYHACTAAAIATKMKLSKAYLHEVMWDMIERGLVAFNPEMPGSVHVTQRGAHALGHEVKPDHRCSICDWPSEQALAGHMRAKHQS